VAAVTSAIPSVASATVPIGLVVIVLLLAGNLRGVRDSAVALAAPRTCSHRSSRTRGSSSPRCHSTCPSERGRRCQFDSSRARP
jgi:hypothetical protein